MQVHDGVYTGRRKVSNMSRSDRRTLKIRWEAIRERHVSCMELELLCENYWVCRPSEQTAATAVKKEHFQNWFSGFYPEIATTPNTTNKARTRCIIEPGIWDSSMWDINQAWTIHSLNFILLSIFEDNAEMRGHVPLVQVHKQRGASYGETAKQFDWAICAINVIVMYIIRCHIKMMSKDVYNICLFDIYCFCCPPHFVDLKTCRFRSWFWSG